MHQKKSDDKFEYNRGGYLHQYAVESTGLQYSCNDKSVFFEWDELESFKKAPFHSFLIQTKDRRKLQVWLSKTEMKKFLEVFFDAWAKKNRSTALKNALPYSNSQKTLALVWMVVTLLFPFSLGGFLLIDAYNTRHCNHLLDSEGKTTEAKLLKVSKNRRGNFTWKLEFATESGAKVLGKRAAYVFDKTGNPTSDITVVYSERDHSCWDLSLVPHQKSINHAQRGFWLLLSMTFGWAFIGLSLVLLGYSGYQYFMSSPFESAFQNFLNRNLK